MAFKFLIFFDIELSSSILSPCMYCQQKDFLRGVEEIDRQSFVHSYTVECCICFSRGPLRESKEEALEAWNHHPVLQEFFKKRFEEKLASPEIEGISENRDADVIVFQSMFVSETLIKFSLKDKLLNFFCRGWKIRIQSPIEMQCGRIGNAVTFLSRIPFFERKRESYGLLKNETDKRF